MGTNDFCPKEYMVNQLGMCECGLLKSLHWEQPRTQRTDTIVDYLRKFTLLHYDRKETE